ncbi:hypothetical protein [Bdellovibrio sp. HCB337]|uniref:hypothetical protein n=1 Tax=Bdellovibrio sp. HCB337 TaxID=3394358 RepID=UPI0039A70903
MNYGKKKNLAFICALSMSAFISSCGPKDMDKVGQAQLCIDDAAQGEAAACLEKIEGIESKGAYALRCSANFIDEGFTQPARFREAFEAFDTNASSNTEAFMSVMTFKSKATMDDNVTFASETLSHCNKSGAKGLMLLGSMASTSTTLAKVANTLTGGGSGTTPTPQQINDALVDLQNNPDPTTIAAIGSAISSTYTASCENGNANESLCNQLNDALEGIDINDPAAVGQAVIDAWAAP